MVISQTQFCVNLLSEYFNPGGPINTKSQLSDDTRRPLFSAKIIDGFRRTSISNVEVELAGIVDQKGDNLFSAECFSFNCFQESGLETSIPNVSDICIVDTGTETRYMDKDERDQGGYSCFVNSFGKEQYFIRGTLDKNDAVYVADFGIVNPIFGNQVIIESNVPFFFKKKVGSLFARTIRPIPAGIRVVTIKRVTDFGIEVIGSVYGQLAEEFYFPHNILVPGRSFTFDDQKIDLENLAINLLLLTSFKRFQARTNQFIYRNNNYSSPEIENIINSSASTLISLINQDADVPQLGTIPKTISSYINNQSQYNSDADNLYLQEVLSCFEPSCFEDFCFQGLVNRSLIERSISNRALAWVVLFLVSYNINYSTDVADSVETILSYILTQRNETNRLFYDGWNQVEEECVELALEDDNELLLEDGDFLCLEGPVDEVANTYDTALDRDESILTSTNVAIFMALLKGFELTQNFKYLSLACDLHTSIEKYLLNSNGLYNHSLTVKNPTIESVSYQLQVVQILQDFKNVNTVINFFKARLVAPPIAQLEPVMVGVDDVLVGTELVYIDAILNQADADSDNNLFTPTADDTITSLDDIFKYNYLSFSGLINLNDSILINFLSTIRQKYRQIEDGVIDNRVDSALIFSIGCIINNQSYLTFDNSKFNTLIDFYNLKFQKEAIFNNMLNSLPINFGWFNEEAISKRSHVGAMLYAKAGELAVVNTHYEYLQRISSLDNLYGLLLNNRADDFGLVRFDKETDTSLRNRIKTELYKRASNIVAFQEKLVQLNSEAIINDNYKASLAAEDFEDSLFSTKWGEGYLPGPDLVNTNIFTVQLSQPLEVDVKEELDRIKPAGMKLQVVETFTFRVGAEIGEGTAINIVDVAGGCDGIDTEANNDVVTEGGEDICLEDDESVILPFTPTPPVLPPLDNPPPTELTCECLSLRGYITIDTLATEVRNMRTVDIVGTDDGFDVNATNETVEPCDLAIKNKTDNSVLDYIQATISPLPFEVITPQAPDFETLYRVDRVVIDNGSTDIFTFTFKDGAQGNVLIIYKEDGGPSPSQQNLPIALDGNFYDVVQTDNYLIIVSNLSVYAVNKLTLNLTTVTTGFPVEINNSRVIPATNDRVFIYSNNASDNLVHHYYWEEASPSTLTSIGTLGTGNPFSTTIYFNTPTGIKRLDQSLGAMELLTVNTFGVDATLENNLSPLGGDVALYAKHINGFNYFVTVSEQSPFNVVNVYQEKDGIVQFLYTDSALGDLSYLAPPFNTNYYMTGELMQLGDFILMTGSNRAYSLSNQSLGTINSFICNTDATTLAPSFTIQAIAVDNAGAITTLVDLITGQWARYSLTQVNKVC